MNLPRIAAEAQSDASSARIIADLRRRFSPAVVCFRLARLRFESSVLRVLSSVFCLLTLAGCISLRPEAPRPGRTTLKEPLVIVPTTKIGNYLVLEAKWDRHGPYHFLIDTGSSVTLISPELEKRYSAKDAPHPPAPRQVRVRSNDGQTVVLSSTTLRRIELGAARFEYVPALVYDCSALTAHLGVKIDGVLGFPLFRETILTLDYLNSRVTLSPRPPTAPLLPGSTIRFNNTNKTPLIPIRIGDTTLIALIDSGSDAPLSLNPIGLNPSYSVPPRAGGTVGTLTGDRTQMIGRLADPLVLGDYTLSRPVVDLTDELSAIGSGILRHFTVTFDQERGQVTFYRDNTSPITTTSRRSTGLSFSKTPAYWRVAGVVPGSQAETARVQRGDLVTRINGEPVANWNLRRYEQLLAEARTITFTFLNGTRESETRLDVFDLVPQANPGDLSQS